MRMTRKLTIGAGYGSLTAFRHAAVVDVGRTQITMRVGKGYLLTEAVLKMRNADICVLEILQNDSWEALLTGAV